MHVQDCPGLYIYTHVYFLFLQQSACSIYLTLMVSVSYNGATVAYYRPRATIPAFSLIKKKSKAFSLRSVLIWFTRTYHEVYTNYLQHTYIPLPLCVCAAGKSTFEIHLKTASLLYLRSRLFFFFLAAIYRSRQPIQ